MADPDEAPARLVVRHTLRCREVWLVPGVLAAGGLSILSLELPLAASVAVLAGLAALAVVAAAWVLRPLALEVERGSLVMKRRFGRPRVVALRGARSAFVGRRLRLAQADGRFAQVIVPGDRDALHEVRRFVGRLGIASSDPAVDADEAAWLEPAIEARRHDGEVYNLDPVHAPMPLWLLTCAGVAAIGMGWLALVLLVQTGSPWLVGGLFPLLAALPVLAWWGWAVTRAVVGLRLTLTADRLQVAERTRFAERTWSVELDALHAVRLDAGRLLLTTDEGERVLRLPNRSHATRVAVQQVVEAQQHRAGPSDRGDPADVPPALRGVTQRARRTE